jgi:hypothetical protein
MRSKRQRRKTGEFERKIHEKTAHSAPQVFKPRIALCASLRLLHRNLALRRRAKQIHAFHQASVNARVA